MEIAERLQISKSDLNHFTESLEKIFNATGSQRKTIDKILSYPLTTATLNGGGVVPVMMQTSASKDRAANKTQAEVKSKTVTIQDATGKPTVELKFSYTEEYYDDPRTGERESVIVPYVNFEQFEDFLSFTQELARTYAACRKYATMLIATKSEFIDNEIQGAGFEMYEKLTGSVKLYPATRRLLEKAISEGVYEATQVTINNFEASKKTALIDNVYMNYKLHNDYKIFGTLLSYLKNTSRYNATQTVKVEAASITPIRATQKEVTLTDLKNNDNPLLFNKESALKNFFE